MKLRIALDKARQAREFADSFLPLLGGGSPLGAAGEALPWQPPEYRCSRHAAVDPAVLGENRGVCVGSGSNTVEIYKILRTRIRHQAGRHPVNTVMVTSARKNEGKTVTCINLGLVFSKELNQTALLVDCDLSGQDIHKYLGVQNEVSLVDYFLNAVPLQELIVWPGVEKFTFISGNNTAVNSSELLSSKMMQGLVNELKYKYSDRSVFFDAPPLLERSEAIAMARIMDGVVMVVEAGVTRKKDVQKAVSLLPPDKFLGFVLNKQV